MSSTNTDEVGHFETPADNVDKLSLSFFFILHTIMVAYFLMYATEFSNHDTYLL